MCRQCPYVLCMLGAIAPNTKLAFSSTMVMSYQQTLLGCMRHKEASCTFQCNSCACAKGTPDSQSSVHLAAVMDGKPVM